jgi:hypothetical protein
MSRDRTIRAVAGLVVVVVAWAGFAAAMADDLMAGRMVAAGFFVVAAASGIAVAVSALVSSFAGATQPIAASAGILLALVAIMLIPFTAARSVCGCTEPPADQLPLPPPVMGVAAPHDVLFAVAIASPLFLLVAANVGRGPRRPMADERTAAERTATDDVAGTPEAPPT